MGLFGIFATTKKNQLLKMSVHQLLELLANTVSSSPFRHHKNIGTMFLINHFTFNLFLHKPTRAEEDY